jgi:hypothetical protein
MCLILNGDGDRADWIYKYKSIKFNLMFKSRVCYTEMTNLLQFTINVWKSHRPPPNTLQLVFEDHFFFRLSWSSRFFMRAAESKMRASNSPRVSKFFFLNLVFYPTPQTKI